MAVTPLAQVGDVAAIWRAMSDTEAVQVSTLIEKASARLRHKCPFDIDARMTLFGTTPSDPLALDPVMVADVVANIVKRVIANPEGVASTTETAGVFSQSRTFTSYHDKTPSEGRGTLTILDSDIDALRPAVKAQVPRVLTVTPSRIMRDPEYYLRDYGAARYPFPWGVYPGGFPSNGFDEEDAAFADSDSGAYEYPDPGASGA